MNEIERKFSEYLATVTDQDAAGMLRDVIFSLPEDQRRELIIKHTPVKEKPRQKVQVLSYDDEDGVSWKLMFGDELVEDGFQSSADAEMWAGDNGYEAMSETPDDYRIEVCRTGWGSRTITVRARCQSEAEALALEEAGDHLYNEKDSDYSIV